MGHANKKLDETADLASSLQVLHNDLIQKLGDHPRINPTVGNFSAKDGVISASCLGKELRVSREFVSEDQLSVAIKYSFVASRNDKDVVVAEMYLRPECKALYSTIEEEPTDEALICKLSNTFIVDHVLKWLVDELLCEETANT